MKALALAAPLFLLAAAPAPNAETGCSLISSNDGKPQVIALPNLRILGGSQTVPLTANPGAPMHGVICDRSDYLPDIADVRVIQQLKVPFYVGTPDRVVMLRAEGKGFSLSLVDGPAWSGEEQARIKAFLDALEKAASL